MISKEALHKKTPQELTALLYGAGLDHLEEARDAIVMKDFVNGNYHLQKVNDILERLGAGINYEAGIIADQLDAVYNYMAEKVIEANYKKDITMIDEVHTHLLALSTAWQGAMGKNQDIQSRSHKRQASAYEQNSLFED
ncbi:flagellar export chaperone FliS [Evansella tamaricis]|uniref:Flagellar export chaperone FliS n=1 Tax=Evansella tamaricis TaxID=2069301 RepID=A0ABS6JMA0_9BACI|nr:flagellar export chaperone FliS [Evansella tamaricis]MBU9714716.1 flagellar export chaperone FliS [Evansella tamaricis]